MHHQNWSALEPWQLSLSSGTIRIDGNLTLTDNDDRNYGQINDGTLVVGGNVSALTGAGHGIAGNGLIKLTGKASGQTIFG